jgi:hypothetical protein
MSEKINILCILRCLQKSKWQKVRFYHNKCQLCEFGNLNERNSQLAVDLKVQNVIIKFVKPVIMIFNIT